MEKIKHAAIKLKDGRIFIGKCHAECAQKAYNLQISLKEYICGFVTSKQGRFVDRMEAAKIADSAKQVDIETNLLFSEDLWDPEFGGTHEYCEIEGYKEK